MLATSRVKRTRPPLAEIVDVLGNVGAVELHSVETGLAFDGVAAIARVQTKVSVARAQEGVSLPLPPFTISLPALPISRSLPSPPLRVAR